MLPNCFLATRTFSFKSLIIFSVLFWTAAIPALAQERLLPLGPTEERLYRFVVTNQLEATTANRFRGGWAIYSKLNGVVFSHEPNSYLTTRQMLLLHEVSQRYELPDLESVEQRANVNLMPFLYDSSYTGEPGGTISFWPILNYTTGQRGVPGAASALVPIANIPNDLDTSSFAALWFLNTRQQPSFVRAFVFGVSAYRDIGRVESFHNDFRWKRPNSGAFMSWAEPEHDVSAHSRIPGGINNVDCAVGLHILATLSQYRRQGFVLGPATERGASSTCRLITDAIRAGSVPLCSVYYDRASEFWWSYSLALQNGANCLDPALKTVRWRLLNRALEVARAREAASNGTEVAELLGSLKRLYPAATRPVYIKEAVGRLEVILRSMINEEGGLVTEDTISRSRGFGMQLEWYAPAFSAALALTALTLP